MKKTIARAFGLIVLATMVTTVPATGQVPLTPRALGMGGAFIGVARGQEVIFLNPANLGLPGTPQWSLAFPQLTVKGTLLGPDFGDLPDIQNFDEVSSARTEEILASIPESGTEATYDFRFPAVAWQVGHLALGVSYGSIGQHTVSKDVVELIFEGYEENRTDYSVGNTSGSRVTFWDVAAAYGRRVGPVSLGVTGHYIHGGTILQSRLFDPRIDVAAAEIDVDYMSVFSRGGTGFGLDVGAAYMPFAGLTVSGAISNLYSTMSWNEELMVRELTLTQEDFDSPEPLDILDRYEDSEHAFDAGTASPRAVNTADGLYDDANFPAIARLGAAWQPRRGTQLGVAFNKQLSDGRLSGEWEQKAAIGVQQKIPLVTLRAGYATNLDDSSLLSGGLTLGVLEFGVAKLSAGDLNGASRSGWIASFGVNVETPQTIN
ncbi:MAG TPA: DUF5723 family protein [Longimicrobiaceae bacterium]|nr:DUF5723 family protein [Longimicrobiaceae bacterium]